MRISAGRDVDNPIRVDAEQVDALEARRFGNGEEKIGLFQLCQFLVVPGGVYRVC